MSSAQTFLCKLIGWMAEWQVIVSDLSQQIIVSPKTRKQNNKKSTSGKTIKETLLKHGQRLLLKPKGLTKCQWEVALKALSKQ